MNKFIYGIAAAIIMVPTLALASPGDGGRVRPTEITKESTNRKSNDSKVVAGAISGLAVVNQDVVCEHLKIASVMREAFLFEMQHGECVSGAEEITCENEKAKVYLDAYHENMKEALDAMNATQDAGTLDKFFGYLVRPLVVIGALIWLI